jgi:uroporphyrinogen-III synthase
MRILITRPREDAAALAEKLRARGHEVLVEPMLEIRFVQGAKIDLSGVQAVLFTSANGARAFAAAETRRDLPAFCVGDTTAAAARAAGFTRVESAAGNVEALANLVLQKLKPADGVLLHAAAGVVAGDLAGLLKRDGFETRRAVLYSAEPATALTPPTAAALKARQVDMVIFFSARTAETFVRLVRAAGLAGSLSKTVALGLSAQVNEAAIGLPWGMMEAARQPQEADVIRAVARHKIITQLEGKPAEEEPEIAFGRRSEDTSKVPEAPPAPRGGAPTLLVWLAVLLALGAGALALLPSPRPAGDLPSAAVLRLETRLTALERQIAALPRPDMSKLDELAARLTALENNPPPETPPTPAPQPPADTSRIEALDQRLAALEQKIGALEQKAGAGPDAGQIAVTLAENRRLSTELARLQDEVASLGASNSRPAAREGLLLAVGQLREAIRRGSPFAAELRTVQALSDDAPALAAALAPLAPLAERPPPARDPLLQRFPGLSANAARAGALSLPGDGTAENTLGRWWHGVVQRLSSVVSVRRVGEAEGDTALARLARADRAIASGDLAAAVAALDGLVGPVAETLASWLAEAKARLAADRQAESLFAAALAAAGSPR